MREKIIEDAERRRFKNLNEYSFEIRRLEDLEGLRGLRKNLNKPLGTH